MLLFGEFRFSIHTEIKIRVRHALCIDSLFYSDNTVHLSLPNRSQKNHRETTNCCYEDEDIWDETTPSKGITRIIGEWSASFDTLVCSKLDDVMANIRSTGKNQIRLDPNKGKTSRCIGSQ